MQTDRFKVKAEGERRTHSETQQDRRGGEGVRGEEIRGEERRRRG